MTTQQQLINKVKAIMNEKGEEQTLTLLSEDTLNLEDYIKVVLADAVSFVQSNCTARCVNKKSIIPPENNSAISSIGVPSDFVSLVAVKLSSWKRTCVLLHSLESEEYKRQCNQYTQSGNNQPVCVLGFDNTGSRSFLLYPSGSALNYLVYEGAYDGNGRSLDESDPIIAAICYKAASLVYSIFENKNTAQLMHEIGISYIPK